MQTFQLLITNGQNGLKRHFTLWRKKQSDTENLLKREPACGNLFA